MMAHLEVFVWFISPFLSSKNPKKTVVNMVEVGPPSGSENFLDPGMYAQLISGTRGQKLGLSLHICSHFVCTSSGGSRENFVCIFQPQTRLSLRCSPSIKISSTDLYLDQVHVISITFQCITPSQIIQCYNFVYTSVFCQIRIWTLWWYSEIFFEKVYLKKKFSAKRQKT